MNTLLVILTTLISTVIIASLLAYLYIKLLKSKDIKQSSLSTSESIEILKLEFEYAQETSINSQKDRLTLVNFYLGLYAGVGTLGIGLQDILGDGLTKYAPFFFIVLGLVAYVFILILVRLRQAWVESVQAMNRIKEFFIDNYPEIEKYILWKTNTIPKAEKFKTISYMSALLISLLGSAGIFAGLFLAEVHLIISLAISLLYFWILNISYYFMLKYNF